MVGSAWARMEVVLCVCVAKLVGLRETVVYNRQVIFEC